MQLLALDILAEGKGLSLGVTITGLVVGAILWLLGWWCHRFLLVLATTVAAGVLGLTYGQAHGIQPLVAGLLFAVAAGVLALALVRVVTFVGGGLTGCFLAGLLWPRWEEPLLCFFVGGFLGLVLVRYWMMVLTSLAGAVVMAYSALWLLDGLGRLDAAAWPQARPALINWGLAGIALVGFFVQFYLDRSRRLRGKGEADAPRGNHRKESGDRDEEKGWWWRWQPPTRSGRKAA